jgi:Holliday junction resolvasome RuvABC endonuclease subunit
MRILAIDPGTHCGWACRDGDSLVSGVWELKPNSYEGGGMRYLRLWRLLTTVGAVDQVAYELVRRHLGSDAAHVYGGITGILTAWCEKQAPKIPYAAIPVGTIKKHATGKGNAGKPAMLAAARERWPEQCLGDKDFDRADALWILDCAWAREQGVPA